MRAGERGRGMRAGERGRGTGGQRLLEGRRTGSA